MIVGFMVRMISLCVIAQIGVIIAMMIDLGIVAVIVNALRDGFMFGKKGGVLPSENRDRKLTNVDLTDKVARHVYAA